MPEVRLFEGTSEELSSFVVSSWKASYAGAVAVPNWSAEYFEWQLQLDRDENRQPIVAAYDGGELAGVLMYAPYTFELYGQPRLRAHASWLSVPPKFRRQRIGQMLQSAAMERARDRGIGFHVVYVFHGSRTLVGPRFWLNSNSQAARPNQTVGPNVGFWARSLDGNRLTQWSVSFSERVLARMSHPFVGKPVAATNCDMVVWSFREADAEQCVSLINQSTKDCDLRLMWNRESLIRHLTGFGQCLVGVETDIIKGVNSYHSLVFTGRIDERVGILDLVSTSQLDRKSAGVLIVSALMELHRSGAVVALKLKCGDYAYSLFFRWGVGFRHQPIRTSCFHGPKANRATRSYGSVTCFGGDTSVLHKRFFCKGNQWSPRNLLALTNLRM